MTIYTQELTGQEVDTFFSKKNLFDQFSLMSAWKAHDLHKHYHQITEILEPHFVNKTLQVSQRGNSFTYNLLLEGIGFKYVVVFVSCNGLSEAEQSQFIVDAISDDMHIVRPEESSRTNFPVQAQRIVTALSNGKLLFKNIALIGFNNLSDICKAGAHVFNMVQRKLFVKDEAITIVFIYHHLSP